MVNEEIISRIQKVIDYYGLTVSAFADAIGVQRSSISHLLNGRNKPSLDFVMKLIASYPEVNLYWLLKGEGDFYHSTDDVPVVLDKDKETLISKESKQAPLPLVERNETGQNPIKIVVFYPDGTFQSFNPKND
ncbi:MAG: helix-turn-helix transcriptional regulator [Muricauda sp.]|nr:helix-turn-helix transcriptional regulator [Allomuricauda sp.]